MHASTILAARRLPGVWTIQPRCFADSAGGTMPKFVSRSQMMKYLGAAQRNVHWAWCAVNDEEKKVYLCLWSDTRRDQPDGRVAYVVQEPNWGLDEEKGERSPARNDQDEQLAKVFDEGYQPLGYVVIAKDPEAAAREIGETKTGFVFELDLEKEEDGTILGYLGKRIELR